MTTIHADSALIDEGWADKVRITVADGTIGAIETGVEPRAGDERVTTLVPAMPNLHSHAFQRAMAGLAERRGAGADSFWSWREAMYHVALTMTPDQMQAVAEHLYMEMLEAGFGRVGEFHYLHHDRDGSPYADPAELAGRIVAASQETGIGLTLLPVFYAQSGFGGQAPLPEQRRFIHSPDAYGRLVGRCRDWLASVPGAILGLAPHSLRAVTPAQLAELLVLHPDGPIHIHVAEQVREVEDCLAWSGARPVEWLLDHAPVDPRWCLIHATQMTEAEVLATVARGATVGLCPITEANLGDGIFPARFLQAGGGFGVGSDSNVSISVAGELRQLEYSQRLATRRRNVVAVPGGSTGEALFGRAITGGEQALGAPGGLAVGASADLVALDRSAAPYVSTEAMLDHWIFVGDVTVDRVWVRGRRLVEQGQHIRRDAIAPRFHTTMAAVRAAL
ncbi:formimidoylglutamate deiminase [Lichenihabitans sp. Uapishka_5]|uniref:formimidoylglutamate deiminase n=1 Tax=Lichenihabitans sp. Uapishka_5 TaxID=3037302 RepID=UPI0029E7EDF7|nr:formimidoylglutamate deiminase [Lichenihabitans sp. Uapishka_5]MDX7951563.1 formimidoylglutamate deiminase [Lichenihabitans sp. Uapishka_5]